MKDRKVSGDRGTAFKNIFAPKRRSVEHLPCWVYEVADDAAEDCFHEPRGFDKIVCMYGGRDGIIACGCTELSGAIEPATVPINLIDLLCSGCRRLS